MANKMKNVQVEKMCEKAKSLGFNPEKLLLVDKRLEEWKLDKDVPTIAVKVLRKGEVAFEGAYGTLGPNKESDSLEIDSIFPIFSITKPVMGALIAILQEEGLLDINDTVRLHLPEFTGDTHNQVRIWHLLSHTSGLDDDEMHKNYRKYVDEKLNLKVPENNDSIEVWDEFITEVRKKLGLKDLIPDEKVHYETRRAIQYSMPLPNPPEKIMVYSSFGYQMLMDIVLNISGKSADEFAFEKLFNPLGMHDTHFILPKEKVLRFVTRHLEGGNDWANVGILNSESGAGGLKSTASDMVKFVQMFLNNGEVGDKRILSKSSIRELLTDHNDKIPPSVYQGRTYESTWGLGWNLKGTKKDDCGSLRSKRAFEHGGWGGTAILGDPETEISIAFFSVANNNIRKYYDRFVNMIIAAINE